MTRYIFHEAATQVVTLDSDQATAREFQSKAVPNYPNEVSSGTSMWLWILIGAGAAVLIAAGVIAGLMIRRRRARPGRGGAGPAGGGPAPVPPPGRH